MPITSYNRKNYEEGRAGITPEQLDQLIQEKKKQGTLKDHRIPWPKERMEVLSDPSSEVLNDTNVPMRAWWQRLGGVTFEDGEDHDCILEPGEKERKQFHLLNVDLLHEICLEFVDPEVPERVQKDCQEVQPGESLLASHMVQPSMLPLHPGIYPTVPPRPTPNPNLPQLEYGEEQEPEEPEEEEEEKEPEPTPTPEKYEAMEEADYIEVWREKKKWNPGWNPIDEGLPQHRYTKKSQLKMMAGLPLFDTRRRRKKAKKKTKSSSSSSLMEIPHSPESSLESFLSHSGIVSTSEVALKPDRRFLQHRTLAQFPMDATVFFLMVLVGLGKFARFKKKWSEPGLCKHLMQS